jgi:hypothetical protein
MGPTFNHLARVKVKQFHLGSFASAGPMDANPKEGVIINDHPNEE